jgi:peptidyl-prolyl cis-trans isomerase C
MAYLARIFLLSIFLNSYVFADENIVTVNGKPITQSQLASIKKNLGPNFNEQIAINNLIRIRLLSQEAIRLGLDKQSDYIIKKDLAQQEILSSALVAEKLKDFKPNDETLKKEYALLQSELGDKEYSIRHIVVKTEDEANAIIKELGNGSDFAKLAKQKSIDLATKENGGLINGWANKAIMAANARDTILKLQKGKYASAPIKTNNVWRIIYVEDIKSIDIPTIEKIKPNLSRRLANKEINTLIESLRAKASITPSNKAR